MRGFNKAIQTLRGGTRSPAAVLEGDPEKPKPKRAPIDTVALKKRQTGDTEEADRLNRIYRNEMSQGNMAKASPAGREASRRSLAAWSKDVLLDSARAGKVPVKKK